MIFRFDDVCINSDMKQHNQVLETIGLCQPDCRFIWAVSPLVESSQKELQRIFPKIWNAYSDFRRFYKMDKVGIPRIPEFVDRATHGLIHVDHRLLSREAQEMSILVSSHLVNANIFVPPFNKWNQDTADICADNGIRLVYFEHGWRCMEYEEYDANNQLWYLHARDWSIESVKEWFDDN